MVDSESCGDLGQGFYIVWYSSHWVYDKAVVTGGGSPDVALVICGTYLLFEGCHSGLLRKLWSLGTGVPFCVCRFW